MLVSSSPHTTSLRDSRSNTLHFALRRATALPGCSEWETNGLASYPLTSPSRSAHRTGTCTAPQAAQPTQSLQAICSKQSCCIRLNYLIQVFQFAKRRLSGFSAGSLREACRFLRGLRAMATTVLIQSFLFTYAINILSTPGLMK